MFERVVDADSSSRRGVGRNHGLACCAASMPQQGTMMPNPFFTFTIKSKCLCVMANRSWYNLIIDT